MPKSLHDAHVHLVTKIKNCQAAVDHQTKPTDMDLKPACMLLSSRAEFVRFHWKGEGVRVSNGYD